MDDLKTNDHPVHTMPNLSSNHLAALWCGIQFLPATSSDDLRLPFSLILILWNRETIKIVGGGYFKKGTKLLSDRYSFSVVRQRFSFKIF